MLRTVALVVVASACSFHDGVRAGDAGDGGGGGGDGDVAPELCATWHPHFFEPCALPDPLGDVHLDAAGGPYRFDTTSGTLSGTGGDVPVASTMVTQNGGGPALVISVGSFTIDNGVRLTVVGDKPLIVAAWDAITVNGAIDAGSHAATHGAGGDSAACTTAVAGTDDVTGGGSGGGGGGGFRGTGGRGGPGDTGGENPGGTGGTLQPAPMFVRGGCSGAASGKAGGSAVSPSNANTISAGGTGGGAIQLTSRGALTIGSGAIITAGGQGGEGAPAGSAAGGGGGGSGGYVGLEAATYQLADMFALAANGGGGGGSAAFYMPNTAIPAAGMAGQDGQPGQGLAGGGAASSCSLAGGSGGASASLDGGDASQAPVMCGGGGGGGATGYIYIFGPATIPGNAAISPMPLTNPF